MLAHVLPLLAGVLLAPSADAAAVAAPAPAPSPFSEIAPVVIPRSADTNETALSTDLTYGTVHWFVGGGCGGGEVSVDMVQLQIATLPDLQGFISFRFDGASGVDLSKCMLNFWAGTVPGVGFCTPLNLGRLLLSQPLSAINNQCLDQSLFPQCANVACSMS